MRAQREDAMTQSEQRVCAPVPARNAPGVFITFEGGDGAGKSTHIKFLAEVLEEAGCEVVRVREPGGTSIGEQLRAVVLDTANGEMAPETELLIYEAARAQIVTQVIEPALSRGAVVLCDRFTDSTLAYQGYGRGLDLGFIEEANAFAAKGLIADKTIILRCADTLEKHGRVSSREEIDRMERAGASFHERVNAAFDDLARDEGERIAVVETSGAHSGTAQTIFAHLSDLFPWLVDGTYPLDEKLAAFDAAHRMSHKEDAS